MKLINEFLLIAKEDLKASKILYKHRLYPQAMFYFSQSVEKANKAFLLNTSKYSEKEILDIGHDSVKVYKILTTDIKRRYNKLQEDFEKLPDFRNTEFVTNLDIQSKEEECDKVLRKLEETQKGKKDLVFISNEEIVKCLDKIQINERDIKEGISEIAKFELTEQMWNECKNEIIAQLNNSNNKEISHHIEEEFNNSGLTIQQIEDMIKKMHSGTIHFFSFLHPLYLLAVITLPHSVLTRYPQKDLHPQEIYTQELAVIQKLPDLFKVHSKALKDLEKYLQDYIAIEEVK